MLSQGLPPTLRSGRIIHGGFVASIFIYAATLWYVLQIPGGVWQHPIEAIGMLQYGMGFAWVASIVILYSTLEPNIKRSLKQSNDLAQRYVGLVILRCAFFESGAIYGMVLALLGAGFKVFLVYAAAALVMLLRVTPTEDNYDRFQQDVRQS